MVVKELLSRSEIAPDIIQQLVFGQVIQMPGHPILHVKLCYRQAWMLVRTLIRSREPVQRVSINSECG